MFGWQPFLMLNCLGWLSDCGLVGLKIVSFTMKRMKKTITNFTKILTKPQGKLSTECKIISTLLNLQLKFKEIQKGDRKCTSFSNESYQMHQLRQSTRNGKNGFTKWDFSGFYCCLKICKKIIHASTIFYLVLCNKKGGEYGIIILVNFILCRF